MTGPNRLRVGVIGCGSIGLRHAQNLITLGHIPVLQDASDQRLDVVARRLTGYAEYERPGKFYHLDAAMICTPVSTHAAIATDLLAAGFRGALFVEKPLASSLEECDVFQTWPHSVVQVGFNWRFNADVQDFRRRHPHNVWTHLRCDANMAAWPGADYGDPIVEMSHELDLVRQWVPDEKVVADGILDGGTGHWFQTQTFTVDLRWASDFPQRVYTVTHGIEIDRLVPSQASIDASYVTELASFLACVRDPLTSTPAATVTDGVSVLEICLR